MPDIMYLKPNVRQAVRNCLWMECLCKEDRVFSMARNYWPAVRTCLSCLPAGQIPCGNQEDTLAFLYAAALASYLDETGNPDLLSGILGDARDACARQMNVLQHAFLMEGVPQKQLTDRRRQIRRSIGCLDAYLQSVRKSGTYTDTDWKDVRPLMETVDDFLSDMTEEIDLDRKNPKETPAFEKNRQRLLLGALTLIEEAEPDAEDPDMRNSRAMAHRLGRELLMVSTRTALGIMDISDYPGIRAYQIDTDGRYLWSFCLAYASRYLTGIWRPQIRTKELEQTAEEAVLRALDSRIISLYLKEERERALAITDTIARQNVSPTGSVRFRDIQTRGEDVISAGRVNPNRINRYIRDTDPELTVMACFLSIAMACQAETFRDAAAACPPPDAGGEESVAERREADLAEQARALSEALALEKNRHEEDRQAFLIEKTAADKEIRALVHQIEDKDREIARLTGSGDGPDMSDAPDEPETDAPGPDVPAPDDQPGTEEDTPEDLQLDARYVFICQHDGMAAKLLAAYPNSVRSEEFSITSENAGNVRAAVCITKSTSHVEYYRIKNQCEKYGVPFFNVNVTGLSRVEQEIARLAREEDRRNKKIRSAKRKTSQKRSPVSENLAY